MTNSPVARLRPLVQGRGRQSMGDRILSPLWPTDNISNKSLWTVILYKFFHDLIYVHSPWANILCRLREKGRKEIEEIVEEMKERNRDEREEQGRKRNRNESEVRYTTPSHQSNHLRDFIDFLHAFMNVHTRSPRVGAYNHRGIEFLCQIKSFVAKLLWPTGASFIKISLNWDFIQIISWFQTCT